ncbi:LOW QUALITY PROTEIN: RRP12-like protein [Paramacrobiotus metropolitanus]|uniref:LOW QUALITY PROTEIN: RRP12-like protein n=1 Tax=Paramacrobiotus metropolitanus TaxID=2943436 RepID=UPI002445F5A8|nr:LOW QUALITY PROTEIN: RRP12-like protein [Paramacrobiotus metropolitanus]
MGKQSRKYTKGKGKRWRKGESGSSNPEARTHRSTAKNSFFQFKLEQEKDTRRGILANSSTWDDERMDTGDAKSTATGFSADTFKSNISAWTQCSISSFNRLQSIWSSNSVLHREMLALLAAVTEIIRERKGKETETEYFAALMTALDSVESAESRTAVLSLLSLLIKRVPVSVLRKQCSQIIKPLLKILEDNISADNNALLRSVLKCITIVLKVQELSVWREASTEKYYRAILLLLKHHKPKVRKQCQSSICSILKGSDIMTGPSSVPVHPMAVLTAQHCVNMIEVARADNDASVTLHVLGLLKDILIDFPKAVIKQAVEAVFKCILLANPLITSVGFKALNGLFTSHPSPEKLDLEVNTQIIHALYDFQPASDDSQLLLPWLETAKNAHISLCTLGLDAALHLPRFSVVCMKYLQSEKPEVRLASVQVLKEIITVCLEPYSANASAYEKYLPQIQRFFLNLEEGLTYQYHAVWNLVLQCLAAFYDVMGHHGSNYMTKSLEKLADLHDTLHFPFKSDLDYAFGRAVRKIGPAKIIRAVSLKLDVTQTPMDLSRSWIIPILRDNVQDTELEYFSAFFLPLASQLRSKSALLSAAGETAEAKSCDILQEQIWSLLPGFCTRPKDIVKNLKSVAKILGQALDERPDLRLIVMAALRNLVTKHRQNEMDRKEVAKYAKNYIPRLFQIYTLEATETPHRLAALETIKTYLGMAPPELITELLDKVLEKLGEADSSTFLQQACVDLVAVLLPYAPHYRLEAVLNFCRKAWSSADHTLQKKGYRCLEQLLTVEKEHLGLFVTDHMDTIKKDLLATGKLVRSPGKASRMKCLMELVKRVGVQDSGFIREIFPEVVLGVREVSEKSRRAAFEVVKEIGLTILKDQSKTEAENIAVFFELLLSGFAGTPEGISASLLALSHAVHEFKEKIRKNLIKMLMANSTILLGSTIREVVQTVIGFVKTMISVFDDVEIGPHVAKLIQAVSSMNDNLRRHVRIKIKDLFASLIRKFGYSMIIELVPEDDQKLLSNVRKSEDRKKRKKLEKREIKDDRKSTTGSISARSRAETVGDILDELASSDDEEPESENVKKRKKSAVFIAEDAEDDIVDFTDRKAAQKITSSKSSKKSKRKEEELQFSADGKIIIPDDNAEDNINDAMSLSSKLSGLSVSKKGKDITGADGADSEDEFKYKAGGTGIHRSLKKGPQKKVHSGAEYRAKKAGGDMKLKGRPDPFAYIPLNLKDTNRRKRAKISGQFKGIVKGARKGATKGSKLRNRNKGLHPQ